MSKIEYQTTKKERMSYGGYFLGQNIIFMIVLQFLMLFYTDTLGIGAAAVGLVFFIARTWDAINDPMLGIIVDKANPKKGKFKPWINAVIVLMPLATVLLFINPNLGPQGNLIYATVTYVLWGMIYTVSDVPIFALATVMTNNVDERVSLITLGRLAAMIAAMVGVVIFMPVVAKMGWTTAAIIMSIIAFITMLPIKFFTVERIQHDRSSGMTIKDILGFVKNNKYLLIFYTGFLIAGAFNTIMVVQTYFAIYVLGDANLIGVLAMVSFLPMILVIPFLPKLIKKFGKKNIYIYGSMIGIVAGVALYIVGYESIPVVLILNTIRSVGGFLPAMMMGMFSSDFVEYGNYVTGKRAEGISFSIQTFATKFSQAIGAILGGFMLEKVYGYVPNVAQTPRAIEGIFTMYTLVPAIGTAIAIVIIGLFYKLTEDDVQRMINEMDAAKSMA